ncbi:AAA family ATPase [Piscinibacter sp. XHJ-5]|uniref:helix-turn-helix transcriptional regulator n=1 Tax=Piscinibacter sp. XHJ-5 TaxID=3037797 RepID=UPI002452F9E1|nr:AAA family ATPase [Piscinibacter sp. XHJ-5]
MAGDAERRFIGRRSELDALQAALARAVDGRPGIVLLTGEPGIGKTRTAQELVEHAGRRGVLALWGRCPEEPGAPPYWPWLQLVRRYAALHDEGTLAETLGAAASALSALDPQQASVPGSAQAGPDAVEARFRLFDAIAAFWQRAAARQPLLLLLDDLHRADVPSLRLLQFVMAEAGASRLMVLGTYRDSEVSRRHPLSDTLAQLHRHAQVQRLLLGGLSPAETAEFVVAAAGTASAPLAEAMYEQTEGHPLFLTELARDLVQSRTARSDGPPARRVPRGVRDVIGARLNRLSPACVPVLQNAAVIGREFDFALLCRLLDELTDEECLAALEEAREAGLVDESASLGGYQFTHALVRDTLYDELPAVRRTRLHQRIAAALEALHAGDLAPALSSLAHHCHAAGPAGDPAKAIEYATRAAERATAMQAHEEAARHYALACATLGTGASDDAQRGALLLGLGEAQIGAGDNALALATFADAAGCARRLYDASLLARAAIGYGNAQWRMGGEGSKAVELIEEALAAAPAADSRERASLLSSLCRALLFSNRPQQAEAAYHEAVAMARRVDDPRILFGALSAIVPGRWYPEGLAVRIESARQALALVQGRDHAHWAVSTLTGWHAGDLMEAGDTAAADEISRLHLAVGERTREPFIEAVARVALAMIATHQGRFAEAEQLAVQALRCGERFDRDNAAGIFGAQMFTLRREQGRLRELAPVLKQFLDSEAPAAAWRPGLAILYCELGADDQARDLFDRLAAGGFAGVVHDAIRAASLAYLAEVCVHLHDVSRAATLYELLMPYAERNIVFGAHTASFGAGARLLGMLATLLSRYDDAQRHFDFALGFDERTGGRPWLAHTRCEFAAMLLRRSESGDAERAASLLTQALDDARELGMQSLEARVAQLQAQLSTTRKPEVHAAGLSAREVQVLRLVAAGKTNQEIADALCRSPATVAIHVRNILGKTQAANRAEAAAFAARHGLLSPQEPQKAPSPALGGRGSG